MKEKENYLKTKFRAAGLLVNVNVMAHFKFKLQLNLEIIIYSLIIVNLHAVLSSKYINLKLKFRTIKIYYYKRGLFIGTVSLLCCLNHFNLLATDFFFNFSTSCI